MKGIEMINTIDCKCCDGEMKLESIFSKSYPKKYICRKCGATAYLKESGIVVYYDTDGKIIS